MGRGDGFQNEGKGSGDREIGCNTIIANDEYNNNERSDNIEIDCNNFHNKLIEYPIIMKRMDIR